MPTEATYISTSAHPTVAQAMYQCVAETAVTTMMAQNFHWNVTGMAFGPLHALFQEIYEDHFQAQDELAERIRSIGYTVDGRLSAMLAISKVIEETSEVQKSVATPKLDETKRKRVSRLNKFDEKTLSTSENEMLGIV